MLLVILHWVHFVSEILVHFLQHNADSCFLCLCAISPLDDIIRHRIRCVPKCCALALTTLLIHEGYSFETQFRRTVYLSRWYSPWLVNRICRACIAILVFRYARVRSRFNAAHQDEHKSCHQGRLRHFTLQNWGGLIQHVWGMNAYVTHESTQTAD